MILLKEEKFSGYGTINKTYCKPGDTRPECKSTPPSESESKKKLASAEKELKKIEEDIKRVGVISSKTKTAKIQAISAASKIRKFAGFYGFGQEEYQEEYVSEKVNQEPFDIQAASQSIVEMKKNIREIQIAIFDAKKVIAEGKKQITDGRKQVASI